MRIKIVLVLLLGCLCILTTSAFAAAVVMTGDDSNSATTSFNSDTQLHWSPAGAPSAGNTYSNGGWLLRTPNVAGNYTFAGDSLTIGGSSPHYPFLTDGSVNNNCLINKTPTSPTITVGNLILDAGTVRDGMGSGDTWTLAGNMFITSNGGGLVAQSHFNVDSVISGSGPLYIGANGSGEAARTVYIDSGLNTYNGSIKLNGADAAHSRLTFAASSLMNFTIGANGVNNTIYGVGTVEYAGALNIDLTAADNTIGDTWVLSSPTTQTYDATFSVNGFTSLGDGNTWTQAAKGVTYQFTQNNGTLSVVPEPATCVMLVLAAMGIAFYSRKK
jgi:hypothetical protein